MFGDKKRLNLVMDVRTRWNSTLHFLRRLVAVRSEFNATLEKHMQSDEIITKEMLDMIEKMVDFLSVFEEVSNRISSERYKDNNF